MDDEPEDYTHAPDSEPIPGYRLLEPLGRGGFGEVWKCEAPGGLLKAIKFVTGGVPLLDDRAPAEEELRAIQRVKAIRHPFLLSMERVERVGNELVIVLELADKGLSDVFAEARAAGKPGIPREQLLKYLREAAEALDVLNTQYGLQHLDVKPHNLFLLSNHVKVGDFGLVSSLSAAGGGVGLGAITPLYASPEVFAGNISAHSDQYSLAVVYVELLTGSLPFDGKSARLLMLQHTQHEPALGGLPEGDRVVVARALAKDPKARFASCTDFVSALTTGVTEVVSTLSEAETRRSPAARTVRARPSDTVKPAALVSAAGRVEVGELIGRTPLTESWRGRLPDGSERVVSVLFGCAGPGDPNVARLAALRHAALLPIEVLQHAPGRLVLSQPPAAQTLRDAMAAYQAQGLPGVPRRELLAHLRTAAEALDHFATKQGLQHLGLNPRSFVLDGDRLRVANFGLAQLVWLPAGQNVAQLNPRYSAPELVLRKVSPACDQYSLALVYHELLTGAYPAPGKPAKRGETAVPVLDKLSEADRVLIGRALHPDPKKRWGSALELVRALEAAVTADEPGAPVAARAVAAVAGPAMQMRFGTSLAAERIRERLEGFRQQWNGKAVESEPSRLVYQMASPRSFWQRWTGGAQAGLEVALSIVGPDIAVPDGVQTRTEVRLDLRARDCPAAEADELIKRVGPLLVESVRQHLQVNSRSRQQERLPWHHAFSLSPVGAGGERGAEIACQGKDISLNGIGFYVSGALPSAQVRLTLPPTAQTPQGVVPARVVRVQAFGDGWFEVGAVLEPPDELPEEV